MPLTQDSVLGELKSGNVKIYNGNDLMTDIGGVSRVVRRARIHAMDFAHFVNRSLRRAGIKLPKPVRSALARFMEGG